MDTKRKGNTAEAKLLAMFVSLEIPVLLPFGDNERYDLVIELDSGFKRIQCKTGRLRGGCVIFKTSSHTRSDNSDRGYEGEIDFFGVFCPDNEKCYLVPIGHCGNTTKTLRITTPKPSNTTNITYAEAYEIKRDIDATSQFALG